MAADVFFNPDRFIRTPLSNVFLEETNRLYAAEGQRLMQEREVIYESRSPSLTSPLTATEGPLSVTAAWCLLLKKHIYFHLRLNNRLLGICVITHLFLNICLLRTILHCFRQSYACLFCLFLGARVSAPCKQAHGGGGGQGHHISGPEHTVSGGTQGNEWLPFD